ncbi:MAG: phosphoribosylanthranilate isomerase [Polyangiaceae bacterium]|nr:phosphoribosylanthranilate isomerase [Polyangiaceae bacterium]
MWVKICGVTRLEDAEECVAAGADAVGLNFVSDSPRRVEPDMARAIVAHLHGRLEVVGVVANLEAGRAEELRREIGLDVLQLHGDESPELLARLLPAAFKAIRIGSAADVELAQRYGGERLLLDARAEGALGGTGRQIDLSLVRGLVGTRRIILAGGLRPENVAEAVRQVKPWGVDVASGVEEPGRPGLKVESAVRAFVQAARRALI